MEARDSFLQNRVILPTAKSSAEIARDIPAQIRARAFFSARVAEAHILERFRRISDDYTTGRIGRGEARELMRKYARAHGKDDGTESLKNLAGTARLDLIVDQQERMAYAVGEHERMYSESALRVFPFVRYHASVGSKKPRSEHQKYDGMIFDKRDPWLRTHTPPWEFGCHCQLEQITAKAAGKTPDLIRPMTPPDQVKVESKSGFTFDPRDGFENNAADLSPVTRESIIRQTEDAVRTGELGDVGIIVRNFQSGVQPVPLPQADDAKRSISSASKTAVNYLLRCGINPDDAHDGDNFREVNQQLRLYAKKTLGMSSADAKAFSRSVPDEIMNSIPDREIPMGALRREFADAAGIPALPVTLERGDGNFGISHLWRDHKDLFLNPTKASLILQETLGWPECRVVVSLKQSEIPLENNRRKYVCKKRIVLHNQRTDAYLVMRVADDRKKLQIVSFNWASAEYGTRQWVLE